MHGVFRPIDGHIAIKPTAEKLGELVTIPRVRTILDAFLEGVPKRYGEINSAKAAIERCVSRQDLSAYLLMLVDAPGPNDIISHPYGLAAHDIGVDATVFQAHRTERIVGMASLTGGQVLSGLVKIMDPRTWGHAKDWTNLAIWNDPELKSGSGKLFAQTLVDISPDDSFVTVEGFKMSTDSKIIQDPAKPLSLTGEFTSTEAFPRGSRQSRADGITVPDSRITTYIRNTSKAAK